MAGMTIQINGYAHRKCSSGIQREVHAVDTDQTHGTAS